MARSRVDRGVLLFLARLVPPPPSAAASSTSLRAALIPTSPLFPPSPLTPSISIFPPSLPRLLPLLPAPTPTVCTSRSSPGRPARRSTCQWGLLLLTSSPASPIVAPSADSAWRDLRLERTWRSGAHPSHLSLRTSLLSSLAASPRFSHLAIGWFGLRPTIGHINLILSRTGALKDCNAPLTPGP